MADDERVAALLARVQALRSEALAEVQALSDAEWVAITPSEGWPVGRVVQHIGESYDVIHRWLEPLRTGGDVIRLDPVVSQAENDAALAAYAGTPRERVMASMEQHFQTLLADLRGLSDQDLDREVLELGGPLQGQRRTADQAVGELLFRHVRTHLESIRAVINAAP